MAHGTCRECAREDRYLPGRGLCAGCYDRRWRTGDWGPYGPLPRRPAAFVEEPYTEKACAICQTAKPLEHFARNNRRADGRGPYCKPCAREKYHRPIRERKQQIEQHFHGEQECRKCHVVKPVADFYWSRDKGKYATDCIECRSTGGKRRWRRTGRELQRHSNLTKFGITMADYESMLTAQSGGCAICEHVPREGDRRLAVDHDHDTGRVRALLCGRCNTGVGLFLDQPRLMRLAASYVELHSARGGDEGVA